MSRVTDRDHAFYYCTGAIRLVGLEGRVDTFMPSIANPDSDQYSPLQNVLGLKGTLATTVSLATMDLLPPIFKALVRARITTVNQLIALSPHELLHVRLVGAGRLSEIQRTLLASWDMLRALSLAPTPSIKVLVPELAVSEPAGPMELIPWRDRPLNSVLGLQGTMRVDIPLVAAGFSVRAYNALTRSGITTVNQLLIMTPRCLLCVSHMGVKLVSDIETSLVEKWPVLLSQSFLSPEYKDEGVEAGNGF